MKKVTTGNGTVLDSVHENKNIPWNDEDGLWYEQGYGDIADIDVSIRLNDDPDICLSLSPVQMEAIVKVLGLEINNDLSVNMFSDESIKNLFLSGKVNPFRLIEKDGEK